MTTAPATSRNADTHTTPHPLHGTVRLWWTTLRAQANIMNMAFAIAMPLFMFFMFGLTDDLRTSSTPHGNISGTILVLMTIYGVFVSGGSLGATVSVERTNGISRLYALTPLRTSVQLAARVLALVALSALIVVIIFGVGAGAGAQLDARTWAISFLTIVLLSAYSALIGLACGFLAKGETAYTLSAFIMVVASFASGMFIPLNQMGAFMEQLGPWMPLYGVTRILYTITAGSALTWQAWANLAAWVAVAGLASWWGASHDTGR